MPKVYFFSGRIHPERYEWGINPIYDVIVLHHDGAKSRFRIGISASQLTVMVQTDSDDSLLEMKNRVSRQARNLADALGHVTGAALDVEILTCVSPEGEHYVFNTAFDGLIKDAPGSEASQHIFNVLVRQAGQSQFVRMALSDLRNAIREPLDTCANCYRAVESIRQEYLVEGEPDTGTARKQSWARLREATGMEETELRWLAERAAPRRHGTPIDATHEDRERALRIARHVVEEHCLAQETEQPDKTTVSKPPNLPGQLSVNSVQQEVQQQGHRARNRSHERLPMAWASCRGCPMVVHASSSGRKGRATSVPEQAENCGHQRSPTDIGNRLRPRRAQVEPLRKTTF
jgi:hypothetical protein